MNKNNSESWVLQVNCPFCDDICLDTVNPAGFPSEMDEDEKFKLTLGLREFDCEPCEHLAVRTNSVDYGNVEDDWQDEIAQLANELQSGSDCSDFIIIISNLIAADDLGALEKAAHQVLPKTKIAVAVEKTKWGCCVSPTYVMVFLDR